MPVDSVNNEHKTKADIDLKSLIDHSEAEISACRERIKILTKSLIFFKKQADSGVPFPRKKDSRHEEIS